jgi:hypothetical protein
MKSSLFPHAEIVGDFSIYMVVLLTSHTFVVYDVSATVLVLYIHYINPIKEFVINYQIGRD